jgi:hypothetical protein
MTSPRNVLLLLRIVAPRAVGGAIFLGPWLAEIAPYFGKAMRSERPRTLNAVLDFARRAGWQTEVVP